MYNHASFLEFDMSIINDLGTLDVTPNKPITNNRRLPGGQPSVDDGFVNAQAQTEINESINEFQLIEHAIEENSSSFVYDAEEKYSSSEEQKNTQDNDIIQDAPKVKLEETKIPVDTIQASLKTDNPKGLLGVTPKEEINRTSAKKKQIADIIIKQGEEQMAEVDTSMLAGQHADIRREQAAYAADIRYGQATNTADIRREIATSADQVADITLEQAGNVRREAQAGFGQTRFDTATGFNEAIKESIKGDWHNSVAIKDARYDLADRVGNSADRIVDRVVEGNGVLNDRFFTVARDTADLRAQVVQAIDTTKMATELNALKGIIEGQRNTTYLSDKITSDGEKTRDLISDLKYHDLSRGLIERNSELVEERNWGRHWYHGANQAQFGQQFAQLQSQMQNFNSQLAETRQGMVNFGTMAGNAGQQTASTNNVR
jgi:hypothetical protein